MAEELQLGVDHPERNHVLPAFGAGLIGLVLEEGLLGAALGIRKPYPREALVLHAALAVAMVVVAGWVFRLALRLRGWRPAAAGGLALLSSLGASAAGAAVLFGGGQAALFGMAGFAGLLIVAGILLLACGAAVRRAAPELAR